MVVILGNDPQQMQDCAASAAGAGFKSVAVLEGGLSAYSSNTSLQVGSCPCIHHALVLQY